MAPLIGRRYEQRQLQTALDSKEAELVAIYGRRRVGKTFLVRHFFASKKCLFFQVSGIYQGSLSIHLTEFKKEIERTFFQRTGGLSLQEPRTWMDAFEMLTQAMQLVGRRQKIVLFFDEFPWMVTHRSGLLQAFDYYWNRFWVENSNIKIVVCGSAASWIIDNLLNNKGGLHNRVTLRIHLEPFTLLETKEYLKSKGIVLDHTHILDLYMCIGGVPYYLKFIEKGLSAIQNINKLCFQKKGTLLDEFKNLFSSLFSHAEIHEELIRIIASKREGISRAEIEFLMNTKGGRLSIRLKELEEAGFITAFIPWGQKRGSYYKVIDEYTLFYLIWIAPNSKSRIMREITSSYWESLSQTPAWKAWAGHAFEAVCYKHLSNIRKALHISEGATATKWRHIAKRKGEIGAQIDLLFDGLDSSINICEIKYRKEFYKLDKEYTHELLRKVEVYRKITKTEKQIFVSLITSSRLKKSTYSEEFIASSVCLDDFFKD